MCHDSVFTHGGGKKLDTQGDRHKSAPAWILGELRPPAVIASIKSAIAYGRKDD